MAESAVVSGIKELAVGHCCAHGFFALLAGALANFSLNRKRDRILRQEEGTAVATALYGEILLLREKVALMAKALSSRSYFGDNEIDDQFIKDYTPSEPTLYPALASKIGILDGDLVLDITRFYDNFERAKDNLPLLVKQRNRPAYHVVTVLKPAVDAIYEIRTGLRKIEMLAAIAPEASDPDSGLADALVSSFEDEEKRRHAELTARVAKRDSATGKPPAAAQ